MGFLARQPAGAVVRVSCTLKETEAVMEQFAGPAVARSGSGVCYGYWENAEAAGSWAGPSRGARLEGRHRIRAGRKQAAARSVAGLRAATLR